MSDTKVWQVGDLCRERDMPRAVMSLLKVVDTDPATRLRNPWYEGRVEVEVGTNTAGRYRGYFPLACDLEAVE